MTDDKVKEAVELLRRAAQPHPADGPLTCAVVSRQGLSSLLADYDALQAERDKLSAEVERLTAALTAEGHAYEGSLAREDEWAAELDKRVGSLHEAQQSRLASEAKLTALVEDVRDMLWDKRASQDHMTACERTMGATHSCTCGADALRQALAHHSAPVGEVEKTVLNAEASEVFVTALADPPEPNAALWKAAAQHHLRALLFAARTAGGVSGPDDYLTGVCARAEAFLGAPVGAVTDRATGRPIPGPYTAEMIADGGLHHATAALINRFAYALAEKLRRAEVKYGYSDGWKADDWEALAHHSAPVGEADNAQAERRALITDADREWASAACADLANNPEFIATTPTSAPVEDVGGNTPTRGWDAAMHVAAAEARRYASFYKEASDGRNTFIIFAEWAEKQAAALSPSLIQPGEQS